MTRALRPWIGPEIRDSQCGFRLIDARLASRLELATRHFDFESELLILAAVAHARVAQVPVSAVYGEERSKIRVVPDAWRFLRLLWRQERAAT